MCQALSLESSHWSLTLPQRAHNLSLLSCKLGTQHGAEAGVGAESPHPSPHLQSLQSPLFSAQHGVIGRRVLLPSPAKSTQLRSVLRCLRAGHGEKMRGLSGGKEIPLVLSEHTPQPSLLLGHVYLFSEDASTRHLLSADGSQTM